mgnify:CR=1 FL=1
MAKAKIKRKTTGFDIAHRIGTCLLAVAAFPLLYFLDFIYYILDHSSIYNTINVISNLLNGSDETEAATEQSVELTEGYINISKFAEMKDLWFQLGGEKLNIRSIIEREAARPLVIALSFLAFVLVLLLVIFIIAAVSNKKLPLVIISGIGMLSCGASSLVFNVFFAKPMIDGVEGRGLADVLGLEDSFSGIIVAFLSDVVTLKYASGFYAVFFILLGICVWTLSFMIVNAGDPEEKKIKEAKEQAKIEKKKQKEKAKEKKTAKETANC